MRLSMMLVPVMVAATACGDDGGGGGGTHAGPYFDHPMFFDRDVTTATPAADSASLIAAIDGNGGWGNNDTMQIDFSFDVLAATPTTPMRSFTATGDFFDPDCDKADVPVPDGGNLEGETGYECTSGDDCHLLVYSADQGKLYEMWRANIVGSDFQGGCLAVWDTHKQYDDTLRGEQCTSADAAGFPISAMLFTADEVAAGHIDHAIRLIMPNDRIAHSFVAPATHGTDTTGGSGAPSYGFHLRLKSTFAVDSLPSEGAKVVARAMQKFGMYHSDGGNIALTAASDRYTTAKWESLLDAHDLAALAVDDFEVIDHGAPIDVTNQCNR